MGAQHIASILILLGIVLALAGLAILAFGHLPFLGRLPGDFSFQSGSTRVYFPLMTSILLSILITVILNVILARR
ncbi:MAG TPA: DUF2905 domain-containing protein [Candidatus Obscuribacterales bacterium]